MSILKAILKRPENYLITTNSIGLTILTMVLIWELFEINPSPPAYIITGVVGTILLPFYQYYTVKEWHSMA